MGKNASKLLDKFKYLIGLDDYDEEYIQEEEEAFEIEEPSYRSSSKNNKIFNLHTHRNSNLKLAIHEPKKFEDATKIIDDLKNRKPVIINFTQLECEIKRQIFDFLNGGIYSLEGNIQKIAKDIFVLSPNGVEVDGNMRDELRNKGIFPWQK